MVAAGPSGAALPGDLLAAWADAPVVLAVLDASGRYLRVNDELAAWHGVPAAEHVGRTPGGVVPDLTDDLPAAVRDVLLTGAPRAQVPMHRAGAEGPGWVVTVRPTATGVAYAGLRLPARRVSDRPAHRTGDRRTGPGTEGAAAVGRPQGGLGERSDDAVVPHLPRRGASGPSGSPAAPRRSLAAVAERTADETATSGAAVEGSAGGSGAPTGATERLDPARLEPLALVARAGELMSTTSLEPGEAVSTLCDLLVPTLADHAFIDLVEGHSLRRQAIRHVEGITVDPRLQRRVGGEARYAPEHPAQRALEHGETFLVPDVRATPDRIPQGKDTEFVQALGIVSLMVLPMRNRERTIGTVILGTSVSGRHYDPEDLRLVRGLVDRAAVSVGNALQYDEQRTAAVQLQRSLLPQRLSSVEGLDVAWRYQPGTDGTEVGGDWADVVELPGGRVAVVVGDVMGRGLHAAAVMGQLRTAVRALAVTDPPPSDLLARLDFIVEELAGGQIVTCVYAVFDPARGRITLANAGHLPPLLLLDGRVYPLEGMSGVPLGVGGVPFTEREAPMPRGALLALYTDGLVERRGGDVEEGVRRLAEILQAGPAGLEEQCDRLLDSAPRSSSRGYGDDVALLLVRATREAEDVARHVRLPSEAASASRARSFAARVLREWGLEDDGLETTTRLLVSELVTNAVRYSTGSDVELLVRRTEDAVLLEVADRDTRMPRMRQASVDEEGGRGLALVQALTTGWGSRVTLDGKVVWCRLPLPGAA